MPPRPGSPHARAGAAPRTRIGVAGAEVRPVLMRGVRFGTAPEALAAVDLGSNSFHMVVARVDHGQLTVVDRLREQVRLGGGLDSGKRLTEESSERALACLERFGQRLRNMPPGTVRAVGTSTLRRARNGEQFRLAGQRALGHPIEVISGREEARLIYVGVAHSFGGDSRRRLVMDIGGGSTEFVIGEGFEAIHRESLEMGCVNTSQRFFGDGRIAAKALDRAELAARMELEPIEAQFRNTGWQCGVGSSGTMRAIATVLESQGWSERGITADGLARLRRAMLKSGSIDALKLKGLREDRKPIFPGGVAIVSAAFQALGLGHMGVSEQALREGLLHDLLGRFQHEDVRGAAIAAMCARYGVDTDQSRRVERTALHCLQQVAESWELAGDEYRDTLRWAAQLHEVGLALSHSKYHKHGAYLVANTDLAGFSHQEQAVLAVLVRGHRRSFPLGELKALPESDVVPTRRLCVLLRLAVLLHRSHLEHDLPPCRLAVDDGSLSMAFPPGWLDEHPLTRADLEAEAGFLAYAGLRLSAS